MPVEPARPADFAGYILKPSLSLSLDEGGGSYVTGSNTQDDLTKTFLYSGT